ncbi:MAG: PqqD family protein [Bacteroidales bacterium]|nr:PqqD family protein [Bacteroidales bacterium]
MKIKEGFVLREVCGEKVIVGEGLGAIDFGKLISLNTTAAWLWEQAEAQGEFSVDSLTEALCEVYEVTTERARTDVQALLDQWLELGIVSE